jgi:glutathione S-transferase
MNLLVGRAMWKMARLQIHRRPFDRATFVWAARNRLRLEKGVALRVDRGFPAHAGRRRESTPTASDPAMRHGDVTLCESGRANFYFYIRTHAFPGTPLSAARSGWRPQVELWLSLVITTIDPVLLRQYGRFGLISFPGTPDGSPKPHGNRGGYCQKWRPIPTA